jgi:hypothetical protein
MACSQEEKEGAVWLGKKKQGSTNRVGEVATQGLTSLLKLLVFIPTEIGSH